MAQQTSGESTSNVRSVSKMPSTIGINLAGAKLRKQLSGTLQEHVSAPVCAKARAQLEKMGWAQGTGLGKRQNGITKHIQVKRRAEQAGIGTEKQAAEKVASTESWWKDSLGDTLAKLSKKRKRLYTDEELFEATGGARFGMRAGKTRNQAKWKRAESDFTVGSKTNQSNGSEPKSSQEGKVNKNNNLDVHKEVETSTKNNSNDEKLKNTKKVDDEKVLLESNDDNNDEQKPKKNRAKEDKPSRLERKEEKKKRKKDKKKNEKETSA